MKKYILLLLTLLAAASNLVGEEPFSGWFQTSTEHFTFIYEKQDEAAVKELLTFCEEVYDQVTELLDSRPDHIKCVVYGRIDSANGSMNSMPPHLRLFVTSPTFTDLNQNQDNWLRGLLVHELTHYVHLIHEDGFYAFLSALFGEGFKGNTLQFLGGWAYEGITTNLETIFTKSGRGRNHFFELYYKAPVMEKKLFNHLQAAYESIYSPPGGRKYVGGYIIVNYLLETFGMDTFTKINKEYVKFPFLGIWSAIEKVTGKSINAIYRGMKERLEKKYADDLLIQDGKKITPDLQGSHYQKGIPTDRGIIAYRWTFDTPRGFSLLTPGAEGETYSDTNLLNTSIVSEESFAATKDGSAIYYAALETTGNHPAGSVMISDIYKYSLDEKRLTKITNNAHLWHPAVNADGSKLIAVKKHNSYSRLVEIDQTTGAEKLLLSIPQATIFNPHISPNGKKITFALNVRGMQDIYVMDYPKNALPLENREIPESFNEKNIIPVSGPDWAGDFFPYFKDNDTIWFTSDRTKDLAIYEYNTNQENINQICIDPVGAFNAFQLDNQIVYTSYSTKGFCLKTKKYTRHKVENDLFKTEPVPPLNKWVEIENSTPYIDAPGLVMWYPFPDIYFSLSPFIIDLQGFGLYAGGRSIISNTRWFVNSIYRHKLNQLYGTFYYYLDLGFIGLDYTLFQQYYGNPSAGYFQDTENSMTAYIPIREIYTPTDSFSLTTFLKMTHIYSISQSSMFSFAGSFNLPGSNTHNYLTGSAGFFYSTFKKRSTLDLFHPWGISGTLQGSMQIPIETGQTNSYRIFNNLEINLPSPIKHHALQVDIDSSFGSETPTILSSKGGLTPYFPYTSLLPKKGSLKGGLHYQMALHHADNPLFLDTFYKGLAGILSAEWMAHWDIGSFQLDRHVYLGLEFIYLTGFHVQNHPFRMGVHAKVNMITPNSFDPVTDLSFYFGF